MALIVEDGTGLPDANSFVTDAEFQTWAKNRGRFDTLPPEIDSGTARAPYLVQAADYLCNEQRFYWRGTRHTQQQALVWPRHSVVDREGFQWEPPVIPQRIKAAQCVMAWYAMNGVEIQPALARGGQIQSKQVGPLSTTYFANASIETAYVEALGYLEPLLWMSGKQMSLRASPWFSAPVTVQGFEGEFVSPPVQQPRP